MQIMLSAAIKAARDAGRVISRACLDLGHKQSKIQMFRKGANDFATQADKDAEAAILNHLMSEFPDHGFVSEECGYVEGPEVNLPEGEKPEYVWIIDPLDGTKNFFHGLENFSVSIALAHKGEVIRAVIFDPSRNEVFTATKGAGAYLDNQRIRVSNRTEMHEALIAGRFEGITHAGSVEEAARYMPLVEQSMGIRHLGSTSLELAYVACGRLDGYCARGLKPWDLAAASLIVLEAGGLLADFEGNQGWRKTGDIVAGTPKIFSHMIHCLNKA
ncbi:MAG: inositol monophosphatase family protein [Alcaligenaceae bacterium]|nr:inositol monophosphatase family protein [Alcaligenaceae bacterium]